MSRFAARAIPTFILLTIAGLLVTARADDERRERAEAEELLVATDREDAERQERDVERRRDNDYAERAEEERE